MSQEQSKKIKELFDKYEDGPSDYLFKDLRQDIESELTKAYETGKLHEYELWTMRDGSGVKAHDNKIRTATLKECIEIGENIKTTRTDNVYKLGYRDALSD